jgi:hypothetical protein
MMKDAIPDEAFDEILKIIQMARLAKKKSKLAPKVEAVEVEVEPVEAEAVPEESVDEMDDETLEKLKKMLGG